MTHTRESKHRINSGEITSRPVSINVNTTELITMMKFYQIEYMVNSTLWFNQGSLSPWFNHSYAW